MKRWSIGLKEEIYSRIQALAEKEGRTMSDLIREAIIAYLVTKGA